MTDAERFKSLPFGWIPYWSLLPMRSELQKICGSSGVQIETGTPAEMLRATAELRVACAPASAICLLSNPKVEIAAPCGVAAVGSVKNIYWGLHGVDADLMEYAQQRIQLARDTLDEMRADHPNSPRSVGHFFWTEMDEIPLLEFRNRYPRLKLNSASVTGSALSKIFYRIIFGKAAFEAQCVQNSHESTSDAWLELVMGDEGLIRRNEFQRVVDLGAVWRSLTGAPAVFSIWQTGFKNFPERWRGWLCKAAESAEATMHVDPSKYLPGHGAMQSDGNQLELSQYWRLLHYRFGPKELESILMLVSLAKPLLRLEEDPNLHARMLRWREQFSAQANYESLSTLS